jgi:phenylacetate-CoA ligase
MLLLGMNRPVHEAAVAAAYRLAMGRAPVSRNAAALEASQWWPRERVLAYQWDKLQRLVRHAFEQVPYYRSAMQGLGMTPEDVRTPGDFARLPVLTKDDLRQHQDGLFAANADRRRVIRTASGGSTGVPVTVYHDRAFVAAYRAVKLRNFAWAGWRPGRSWVRLWGSQFDVKPHQALRQRLWDRVTRVRVLPCFDMTEATMAQYARDLQRDPPDVIEAYVTPMYHFACFLEAQGVTGIRPRGVICSAEMLFAHQRETIERVFGCRVFNRYGGREMGDIAHECPAGGFHVNAENYYVEFWRDGRPAQPGEPGDILLTALDLYSFPLLRYRVEDVGSPDDGVCRCGRGLPLMRMVEGRVQDMLTLPGGRYLPGEFFPHLFKDFDIVRFQVLQETVDHLTVRAVRGPKLSDADVSYLTGRVHEYAGGGVTVAWEFVEAIAPTASGKFRYTVSQVPPNFSRPKEGANA